MCMHILVGISLVDCTCLLNSRPAAELPQALASWDGTQQSARAWFGCFAGTSGPRSEKPLDIYWNWGMFQPCLSTGFHSSVMFSPNQHSYFIPIIFPIPWIPWYMGRHVKSTGIKYGMGKKCMKPPISICLEIWNRTLDTLSNPASACKSSAEKFQRTSPAT